MEMSDLPTGITELSPQFQKAVEFYSTALCMRQQSPALSVGEVLHHSVTREDLDQLGRRYSAYDAAYLLASRWLIDVVVEDFYKPRTTDEFADFLNLVTDKDTLNMMDRYAGRKYGPLKYVAGILDKAAGIIEQEPESLAEVTALLVQRLADRDKLPQWGTLDKEARLRRNARQVAAVALETNSERFKAELMGGRFNNLQLSPQQKLAVQFLAESDYGEEYRAPTVEALIKEVGIYAVRPENLYAYRYFNNEMQSLFDEGQLSREKNSGDNNFGRAYVLTTELLQYMSEFVTAPNAGKIHSALAGIETVNYSSLIRFSNQLAQLVNQQHFADSPQKQLDMLDPKHIESLPQAFDRLLYVVWADPNLRFSHRMKAELCDEVRQAITNMVEVGIQKNRNVKVITLGDVIARFPNASEQELEEIIARMQRGGGLQSAAMWYRDCQRKSGGRTYWTKWRRGYGILS